MLSMLEICQDCADLLTVQKPDSLFDEDSQHNAVFLSVAKKALDKILRYGDWQELTKTGCLRTVANKSSYLLKHIAPDFFSLLNNTIYVKDSKEKVIGAITPEQWMRDKYFNIVGTDIRFVIQNGMIRFLNPPAAGLSVVFQYRSNTVVYDAKTLEEKPQLTKNTDIPVFDEYLVKLAVEWIWLKRNGMDYAEEFNEFEREIKKRYGAGLATKDINLSGAVFDPADTGVFINAATSDKQK